MRRLLLQQEVELGHEAKRPICTRSLRFRHGGGCSHGHGFGEMPTGHSGPQPLPSYYAPLLLEARVGGIRHAKGMRRRFLLNCACALNSFGNRKGNQIYMAASAQLTRGTCVLPTTTNWSEKILKLQLFWDVWSSR